MPYPRPTHLRGTTLCSPSTPTATLLIHAPRTPPYPQDNFVFSKQRDSYLMQSVTALVSNDKDTRATLALGDAYQVGACGLLLSNH